MITFELTEPREYHTDAEIKEAKDYFMMFIGDLRKDFEDNNVTVKINLDAFGTDRYTYKSNKEATGELVEKLMNYRKTNPL